MLFEVNENIFLPIKKCKIEIKKKPFSYFLPCHEKIVMENIIKNSTSIELYNISFFGRKYRVDIDNLLELEKRYFHIITFSIGNYSVNSCIFSEEKNAREFLNNFINLKYEIVFINYKDIEIITKYQIIDIYSSIVFPSKLIIE
jgi:hypothetical protein